jgi:hypothetical protein
MKFILYTSERIYKSEWDKIKKQREEKEKEELKKLGFTFKNAPGYSEGTLFISGQPSIDIGSIEELIELSKQLECPLIIDYRNDYLEIYNDYRE